MSSTETWKKDQNVYWNGYTYNRHSDSFRVLVRSAYRAMLEQNPDFCEALKATGSKRIFHTIGNSNPCETILTEQEFCDILTELRDEL